MGSEKVGGNRRTGERGGELPLCTPISASLVLHNRISKTGRETLGTQFHMVAYVKKLEEEASSFYRFL